MTRRLIAALLAAIGLLSGVAHAQTQPPNAVPSAQTAPTSPPAPVVVPGVPTEGAGVPLSETPVRAIPEQVPELTPVPTATPEPFFDQPPDSPPVQMPLP